MPQFTHDCKGCHYLGSERLMEGLYDFYYCPQGSLPTVIARYGNDGPDYQSGLEVARDILRRNYFSREPLARALNLAKGQGYIK